MLHTLTLDQKIAQMLLIGFRGFRVDEQHPLAVDLSQRTIGGVILFDYDVVLKSFERNISAPAQLQTLMNDIHRHAARPATAIPPFIGIDQEGGTVNRLKPEYGFPATTSHREIGERDTLHYTAAEAAKIAELLAAYGLNLNFAPCLDLAINKANKAIYGRDRTFSDHPNTAALHAEAYITEHRKKGILTCPKHFPGHGSALADSHWGVTDVTDTWQEYELEPYRYLIGKGLVDMIMMSHIFHRGLDPDYPASISARIMQGLLREKLGFEGVIITDDLQMQAITDHFGLNDVVRLALLGGADILAFGNNLAYEPDVAERCIVYIKTLLDDGVITEARIDESVARILKLKKSAFWSDSP